MAERTWTPERLQALMEGYGFDDLKLADRLSVTQQSVRNWLQGEHHPTLVYCRVLERMERRLAEKGKP